MKKTEQQLRVESLLEKCRKLLEKEGIPAAADIEDVVINPRIRSRFGSCRRVDGRSFRIEVSSHLMEGSDRDVETVLLHELLHTCPRCMNHGKLWKSYAERINKKHGYRIRTASRYEDLGLENPGSRETVKYHVICTGCGMELTRKRRCRLVENIGSYRCGKCGGKLKIL